MLDHDELDRAMKNLDGDAEKYLVNGLAQGRWKGKYGDEVERKLQKEYMCKTCKANQESDAFLQWHCPKCKQQRHVHCIKRTWHEVDCRHESSETKYESDVGTWI